MSDDQRTYWKKRFVALKDLRSVGNKQSTHAENHDSMVKASRLFRMLVNQDFPDPTSRGSVLDIGYGLGHYAILCKELGFARYLGIDFAAPADPIADPNYRFVTQDFGASLDLGERFDLVLGIDVLYHIVDPSEFAQALANIKKHAAKRIYVTGLFYELKSAGHCHHRDLSEFSQLGRLVDLHPWRDTKLARFFVE